MHECPTRTYRFTERHTFISKIVLRLMRSKLDAMEGELRVVAEIIRLVQTHIKPRSLVVSDGWAATKTVVWRGLIMDYEYCVHSRRANKMKLPVLRNRL